MTLEKARAKIYQDEWFHTMCGRCYADCAVRMHVVNGVAVKIEGEPDSTMGAEGGLCGKGVAGLQTHYDPNRINVPLRRTNPEKGLFADPKWKEITWEEAYAEIVPRLKKIMSENPQKLMFQTSIFRDNYRGFGSDQFRVAFGASMTAAGAGLHCGAGAHPSASVVNASWSVVGDFRYTNYAMYFGSSKGVGSGHSAMVAARQIAEARARGVKVVSFDPQCNFSGGKATEWVPLLPGTDGAVVLAMCNIIVNELGMYDVTHLKKRTNAPYLIGPDGKYVREKGPARGVTVPLTGKFPWGKRMPGTYIGDDDTNKPLVWDAVDNKAKVYDDPSIKDYALEGSYEVRGIKCQPAFQLVREHLKKYTPEMASKASTVPAATIHRIATEFAHAAQIGSTITIQGHNLPFRPVSAWIFRGAEGHENSWHTCAAVAMLNEIVGSAGVPGGTIGWPARTFGYPGSGKPNWSPYKGMDGLIETDHFGPNSGFAPMHGSWPIHMPHFDADMMKGAITMDMKCILPEHNASFYMSDKDEIWQKLGIRDRPEMMISWGCNAVMSCASRYIIEETLKKIDFIVYYDVMPNETIEGFADIVLPATSPLEESNCEGFGGQDYNHAMGMDDWSYHIRQPVVKPGASRKQFEVVLMELAERLGITDKYLNELNASFQLEPKYAFKPGDKPTPEEMSSRMVKNWFGEEHDWEWFKEHGFIRWPKKVEEVYWRYFLDVRAPIYLEYLVEMGEKAKEITKKIGLDVDFTQYTPLISWTPCSIHRVDDPQYDLYCFSYRDVLHTGSFTQEQPWLDEASRMNPYTYNICMNVNTARRKGFKEGDIIEIETIGRGRKVEGSLKLMEGQHPQTVSIAACSGSWARGKPIARGKGTNFDILLELDMEHMDPVSGNIETAVRVKVKKIRGG